MTGPEHFREAERLLDGPEPYSHDEWEAWQRDRADNLAAAQAFPPTHDLSEIAESRLFDGWAEVAL